MLLASVQLGRVTDSDREFYAKPSLSRTHLRRARAFIARVESRKSRSSEATCARPGIAPCTLSQHAAAVSSFSRYLQRDHACIPPLRIMSHVDKNAEQAASFAMPTFFRTGCCRMSDLISYVGFFDEFRVSFLKENSEEDRHLLRFLWI